MKHAGGGGGAGAAGGSHDSAAGVLSDRSACSSFRSLTAVAVAGLPGGAKPKDGSYVESEAEIKRREDLAKCAHVLFSLLG